MLIEKARQYAESCVSGNKISIEQFQQYLGEGKEITTDEVVTQRKWFLSEMDKRQYEDDFKYYLDESKLTIIENLLKLMNFATGFIEGSIYNGLEPFQAFFLTNIFGWRFKDDKDRFRYREVVLFIARKNAKTFMAALIIIILMLTEDAYSEFYSICLDRDLAGEIKKAIKQIIEVSPAIQKYFKIPKTLSGRTECLLTNSTYQPRTAVANSNNGLRPAAFIADEAAAMKDTSNINAMRSGQKSVKNPLMFKLTTAYAEDKSPMLEELDYLRKIYKGLEENDRLFALVYYASEEHLWDDIGMYMANPLRVERNYEEIQEARKSALAKPNEQEEYLTKCMNHFVPSNIGEAYINIDKVRLCKTNSVLDWSGKDVYLGLDLAMTNDNVSVSMVRYDAENDLIYGKSWAFVPTDRIPEKNNIERTDYNRFIREGNCFSCGEEVVSYTFIENFIMEIEKKYGCNVLQIGYDRYNCISTAGKLEENGMETVEVKQHSSVLHAPTKLLREYILQKKFVYEKNTLYENNFINAKCTLDTNQNMYLNKKKSSGKIDMIASTVNAIYLLQQQELLGNGSGFVQVG